MIQVKPDKVMEVKKEAATKVDTKAVAFVDKKRKVVDKKESKVFKTEGGKREKTGKKYKKAKGHGIRRAVIRSVACKVINSDEGLSTLADAGAVINATGKPIKTAARNRKNEIKRRQYKKKQEAMKIKKREGNVRVNKADIKKTPNINKQDNGIQKAGSVSKRREVKKDTRSIMKNHTKKKYANNALSKKSSSGIKAGIKKIGSSLMSLVVKVMSLNIIAVGPMVLMVFVAVAVLILIVSLLYSSPLAIFLPPLYGAENVKDVLASMDGAYHSGYEDQIINTTEGERVEIFLNGNEGISISNNYRDVLLVYMAKYGTGNGTTMDAISSEELRSLYDEMNSYSVSYREETSTDENGGASVMVKTVQATQKTYVDYLESGLLTEEEKATLSELAAMYE